MRNTFKDDEIRQLRLIITGLHATIREAIQAIDEGDTDEAIEILQLAVGDKRNEHD